MMTCTRWFISFLTFILTACTPFGGFMPPPAGWTYYAGGGATQKEIEMAYLECGFPYPGDFREMPRKLGEKLGFLDDVDKEYAALAEKYHCMKDAGFPTGELKDPCVVGYGRDHWPACKPDSVIPKRSVANRLNSPYCKLIPKAKICQLDYDPSKVETSTHENPKPISVAPSTDLATKLQDQVQKDSNAQMNQLLQGAGTRK